MSTTRSPISAMPVLPEPEVTLVRWPEEASLREALAALGRPRMLLVQPGLLPPADLDATEDWLRWPPDPAELDVRVRTLRSRLPDPVDLALAFDDDGILRRGDRWVAVSEAQTPILRLLFDHLDRVVRFDAVVEAYASGGGSSHPASVRTVLSRLDARVRTVGLEVTSVRRRGVVLRVAGRG